MKITEKFQALKKRYKYYNSFRFAYNDKAELAMSGNKILVHYLLYDDTLGYWIFNFIWYDKTYTVLEWKEFLEKKSIKILQTKVLFNRNLKYNSAWIYKDLICWSWPNRNEDYRKKDYRSKT